MAEIDINTAPNVIQVNVIGSGPTGPQGAQGPQGPQGIQGIQGVQGPAGQDGADGQNGTDGVDGVSPTVEIVEISGGHTVTISDDQHPNGQSFDIMNGVDGQDGADGQDGTDGVSPEITIASITGGHSVTITDADHPGGQTFNVMNGTPGPSIITEPVKLALLQLASKVAYIDAQGQDYYQDLYDALYPLTSITAVYTQSGTVYTTDSLDSLKSDLVVTAVYDGGSTETVSASDYTLSGNLTEGTSVITVSYGGKTTTFNVTVTAVPDVYTVVNTLTGCTNSNTAATITKNTSYSGTITAASGYTLTGATVSITMGGIDITSSAYNAGTISIASVTGNIVISVSAAALTLSSISAVYTQSGTVYDTDTLDSLKADLVVTATWSDSSTATVAAADYTLSGSLTAGTSTITVAYGGKTTTFTVTVSHADNSIISWDFTQSLTDSKQGLVATLGGNATQDSSGLHINSASDYAILGKFLANNQSYEIDVADMDTSAWTSGNGRLFIWYNGNGGGFGYHGDTATWSIYRGNWYDPATLIPSKDYFENSTIKIKVTAGSSTYKKLVTIYKNGTEIMSAEVNNDPVDSAQNVYLGSTTSGAHSMTITGFRVYSEV